MSLVANNLLRYRVVHRQGSETPVGRRGRRSLHAGGGRLELVSRLALHAVWAASRVRPRQPHWPVDLHRAYVQSFLSWFCFDFFGKGATTVGHRPGRPQPRVNISFFFNSLFAPRLHAVSDCGRPIVSGSSIAHGETVSESAHSLIDGMLTSDVGLRHSIEEITGCQWLLRTLWPSCGRRYSRTRPFFEFEETHTRDCSPN